MCWEFTDFCDVRRLADGRFSQSVCFLTWAPVSQVRTLRLCAIFLERRAAPPQEGWRPFLFNRSGLPQKLVQLSIQPMLFCGHHLWHFSTAWYGMVQYGSFFGGFPLDTVPGTWYFFCTTLAGVPCHPYRYQNVTCKLYWSPIGRRTSSLLHHWTCDTRPNIDPLDLNQHSQRKIGRNFCLNKRTFLYQPKNSCFIVCWGSTDVPLIDSRGADPARAWWVTRNEKALCNVIYFLHFVYF